MQTQERKKERVRCESSAGLRSEGSESRGHVKTTLTKGNVIVGSLYSHEYTSPHSKVYVPPLKTLNTRIKISPISLEGRQDNQP